MTCNRRLQEADQGVLLDLVLLVRHEQHLDAGEDQEAGEEVEHPVVLVDDGRAERRS